MKPPILNITTLLLFALISTLFAIVTSGHPLHAHHHLAPRERIPFWNDPGWGTKAPETPRPMATAIPTSTILLTTPEVAASQPTTSPGVAVAAPTSAIVPLKSAAPKASSFSTPGVAPLKPVSSSLAKNGQSCLDLNMWATASGPSPMMSVAGFLSKNKEPICSIWAVVDQSSGKPVELSCTRGHESSFRFDNGEGRYKGEREPINFNVVRSVEAKVNGKDAWSWKSRVCWKE